jgi:hypothetical protein
MQKLAIVGSHRDTRHLAPWDDAEYDIWVFNEALSQKFYDDRGMPVESWCKRASAVFQLHDPTVYKSEHNRSDRYHWDWLKEKHSNLTIYMQEQDPEVPNAKRLPLEDLIGLMGNFRQGQPLTYKRYLTSTPAIALALGILKGYQHIELYGIEMHSETEYTYQRECVLYWMGLATGKGIHVDMISGDSIFDVAIYGYEGYVKAEPEEYRQRVEEIAPLLQEAKRKVREAEDALEDSWSGDEIGLRVSELSDLWMDYGRLEAIVLENERYRYKAEEMIGIKGWAFIDRNEYELASANANKSQMELGPMVYRTAGHVDLYIGSWYTSHNPLHMEQLKTMVKRHVETAYNSGRAQGVYDENRRLAKQMDKHLRAAGGHKTVQSVLGIETVNQPG